MLADVADGNQVDFVMPRGGASVCGWPPLRDL